MNSSHTLGRKSLPAGCHQCLQVLKVTWTGKLSPIQRRRQDRDLPNGHSVQMKREIRWTGPTHQPLHRVGGSLPRVQQGFSFPPAPLTTVLSHRQLQQIIGGTAAGLPSLFCSLG